MQATQFKVSEKLTLVSTEVEDGEIRSTHYSCDVRASIAGDSIWDCEITDADDVRITNIYINEGVDGGDMDGYRHIAVVYTVNGEEEVEESWRLYTDNGFEATVSELLGEEITFTEQGMQDDNYASME
jgi:hypothetical protein